MSNSGTTTWYAFQDPKTGREYFHEPRSGDTSWVLPTSSNTTTRSKIKIEKGASGSRPKAGGATTMDGKVTQSRRKRLGSIGVTIVSILAFNTLFLLVLVKVLYDKSNMNISGQFQVYNQSIFPSDDGTDVPILEAEDRGIKLEEPTAEEDNEEETKLQEDTKPDPESIPSDENSVEEIMKKADEALRRSYQSVDDHDKKDDSVEDTEETADATATEESSTSSHQPVPEMDGTHIPNDATETEMDNIEETDSGDVIVEEELITEEEKVTEEEEAPAKEESVEKGEASSIKKAQINKGEQNAVDASDTPPVVCLIPFSENFIPECKYRAKKSSGLDQPPPQCWIPFSHMFLPECQSRVKKGLSTPLAGAEEWAWI